MEVYWNWDLITTQTANTTNTTFHQFFVTGSFGYNLLKFKEIGDASDMNGMFVDEVSLTCEFYNLT